MIQIANRTYEVIVDHKNGWKPEAFRDRYSEVLDRYDYIVGDWGYSQLRLRGFFKENHPKATKETSIATLQDYLNEYCNFGCAYFIIEKMPAKVQGQPGEDLGEPEAGPAELTIAEAQPEPAQRYEQPQRYEPSRLHEQAPRHERRQEQAEARAERRQEQSQRQERRHEQGPRGGQPRREQRGEHPSRPDRGHRGEQGSHPRHAQGRGGQHQGKGHHHPSRQKQHSSQGTDAH